MILFYLSYIQNVQTIIQPYKTNIKMGKDLNVSNFGMGEQYRECANHNSTVHI